MTVVSRRQLLIGSGAMLGLSAAAANAAPSSPMTPNENGAIRPALLRSALDAFQKHKNHLGGRDTFAVVDFAAPSRARRFHIVDAISGRSQALLVAHGRGSDPAHSGWLQRFSNSPGSAASSAGAYLTGDTYMGKHGISRRLEGLDPENSNVAARAVVIHAAWYVSPSMALEHGKLGRSEGCFAFSESDLDLVLNKLGPRHMIYANRV